MIGIGRIIRKNMKDLVYDHEKLIDHRMELFIDKIRIRIDIWGRMRDDMK